MRQVIVFQGVPGSGKSTIGEEFMKVAPGRAVKVSADDFFTERGNGTYAFDFKLFGEAHAQCLRRFLDAVQQNVDLVIVDNTNTTVTEIAPYMALAAAFGYEARLVRVKCDPKVAAARNTHGVPLEGVLKMAARMTAQDYPPWWSIETIEVPG